MRQIVEACRTKRHRFVFTASTEQHAKRCLDRVGISDLFAIIIDTRLCGLDTKHSEHAFEQAMLVAQAATPRGDRNAAAPSRRTIFGRRAERACS